ncbi:MAG: hypothetical protein ACXWD4_14855 [Bacteroidia bacterium]
MMKHFLRLLYMAPLLFFSNLLLAQEETIQVHGDYICNHAEAYIPDLPQYSPIKRLRLVVHVFGKDDGSGNLQNTPEQVAFIGSILNHVNWFYTEPELQKPASPKYWQIPDSRIRFVADTILFHQNTDAWDFKKYVGRYNEDTKDTVYSNPYGQGRAEALYQQYVTSNMQISVKQKDSALHIFFVEAPGFEDKGMAENINSKRWVYSIGAYHHYKKGKNHWSPAMLLAHEIAHALGLFHPYDFQQCDDLPVTQKGTTNNIVDSYPNEGSAITPCQMGVLHKNLSIEKGRVADIVIRDWCRYIPDSVIRIPAGDTVYFTSQKHFAADVYTESGAVLVVKCTLAMPAGAAIYVAEKSTLIIDGGTITNICGQKWNGVKLEKLGRFLGVIKRKSKGVLVVKNGGKIENAVENVSVEKFE